MTLIAPQKFVSNRARAVASSVVSSSPKCPKPALLKTTSMRPNARFASAKAAGDLFGLGNIEREDEEAVLGVLLSEVVQAVRLASGGDHDIALLESHFGNGAPYPG